MRQKIIKIAGNKQELFYNSANNNGCYSLYWAKGNAISLSDGTNATIFETENSGKSSGEFYRKNGLIDYNTTVYTAFYPSTITTYNMKKCPKCNKETVSWSKFKDLKKKEGLGIAICGSIIKGVDHFLLGENRSVKMKPHFRTLDLFYCKSCKRYFLRCPGCNQLNNLAEMPSETRTIVTCLCGKRVLYASEDYQSGG